MKKILFTLLSTASMVAGAIALGAPAQARHLYVGVESPTVVRERVHVVRPTRVHIITPTVRVRRIGEPAFVERTRMSRVHVMRPEWGIRETRIRDNNEPRMIERTRESRVLNNNDRNNSSFVKTKRIEAGPNGVSVRSKTTTPTSEERREKTETY